MALNIQARTPESSVWKVYSHIRPTTCPECQCQDSLRFISYDPNYSHTLTAEIHQCVVCQSWLDLLRPKSTYGTLKVAGVLSNLRKRGAVL